MIAIAVSVGGVCRLPPRSVTDGHCTRIHNDSIRLQSVNLQGQTEHQVLRIEESSSDGAILQQGIVVFVEGMATAADIFDGCMTPAPTRSRLSKKRGGTKREKTGSRREGADKEAAENGVFGSTDQPVLGSCKTSLPRRLPRWTIQHSSFAPSTAVMN